jgi:SlyX protein
VANIDPLPRQLEEVQSQLAFQEHALESLNEALAQQQQEILLLRRQLELLKQRQDEVGVTQAGGEEKPPHY